MKSGGRRQEAGGRRLVRSNESFGVEFAVVGAIPCDCLALGRHTGLPLQEWLFSRQMAH